MRCRARAPSRKPDDEVVYRLSKVLPGVSGRPARDRATLVLYAAMGVVGYAVNGWGSILGPLQRELGVPRTDVAFYPSLFALALVAVGLIGGRAVERVGHRAVLIGALGGVLAGVLLLGTSTRPLSLAGALVLGVGAALMIQVVPAALTLRQSAAAIAALGEANAVSSVTSVLAPASVAATIALGFGWQLGYLLPVLPVTAVLLLMLLVGTPLQASQRHGEPAGPRPERQPAPGLEPGRLLGRWCDLLLAVSIEFCLVYWAADAFREWHGCTDAAATSLGAGFLVGMALTRCVSAKLTTGRLPSTVVLWARLRDGHDRFHRLLGIRKHGGSCRRPARGRNGRRPPLPGNTRQGRCRLAAIAGPSRRPRGPGLRNGHRPGAAVPRPASRTDRLAHRLPRRPRTAAHAGHPLRTRPSDRALGKDSGVTVVR